MTKRIWPLALMIGSNIIYHISAKEIPSDMDAFASLTVTYAVACVLTFICFFIFKKANGSKSFVEECRKSNWAPFALGIVIVGLEFGWIMAYKAGWQVSMGYIVVTSVVSTALLAVGYFLYKEKITRNKVIGLALCLLGLVIINM
ncbi:MAG: EamA family transporter [Mogibacterium sp.]|nr:EamA family transporter [Mogibacterium sp.]